MNDDVIAALTAICRRTTGRGLDACPPTMVPADLVAAAVFALREELGPRETTGPLPLDDDADALVCSLVRSACANGAFAAKILKPVARDELREYLTFVVVPLQVMAEARMDYGPLPSGLSARDQALAACATEILGNRSPQRLLARQRRAAN
jgi:hypothetical protein